MPNKNINLCLSFTLNFDSSVGLSFVNLSSICLNFSSNNPLRSLFSLSNPFSTLFHFSESNLIFDLLGESTYIKNKQMLIANVLLLFCIEEEATYLLL